MRLSRFLRLAGLIVLALSSASEAEILRVLTYNIHHGRGTDGQIDLDRIAAVINSVSPHLVALQEVDRNTERSGGVDQPTELARRTGLRAVFEKNIDFQGGEYGNAVLTRLDVVASRNVYLPSLTEGEQRGLLIVTCELPAGGGPVRFMATHFDYRGDDEERLQSVEVVNRQASQANTPAILAGDLNALFESRVMKSLTNVWLLANRQPLFTIPAAEPVRQIDYVATFPRTAFVPVAARVLEAPVESDHRPLLITLKVAGQ